MFKDHRVTQEDVKANTPERFWTKIKFDEPDKCWEWKAFTNEDGYGYYGISHGISEKAHRFIYKMLYGELKMGVCVLHKCDNPPCVNPNHLLSGTKGDNNRDRALKGRNHFDPAKGSQHWFAKLNEEKVYKIKQRLKQGKQPKVLALEYSVSVATIYLIKNGIRWKHVKID